MESTRIAPWGVVSSSHKECPAPLRMVPVMVKVWGRPQEASSREADRTMRSLFMIALFELLEYFEGLVPEHVDGFYEDALVGAVDTTEGGAIAYHVHFWVFLAYEAALKTCVYCADDGFFAVHLAIDVYGDFEERAVGVGSPAGVSVAVFDAGACEAEGALDFGGGGELGAFDAAALAGGYVDYTVAHFDGGEVGGGFDEVGDFAAHGKDAVCAGIEEVDEFLLGGHVDDAIGHFDFFDLDFEGGFCGAEFELHGFADACDHGFEGADDVLRDGEEGLGLASDGVAEVSAGDGGEAHGVFVGSLP